jgi:hypothetical protein
MWRLHIECGIIFPGILDTKELLSGSGHVW